MADLGITPENLKVKTIVENLREAAESSRADLSSSVNHTIHHLSPLAFLQMGLSQEDIGYAGNLVSAVNKGSKRTYTETRRLFEGKGVDPRIELFVALDWINREFSYAGDDFLKNVPKTSEEGYDARQGHSYLWSRISPLAFPIADVTREVTNLGIQQYGIPRMLDTLNLYIALGTNLFENTLFDGHKAILDHPSIDEDGKYNGHFSIGNPDDAKIIVVTSNPALAASLGKRYEDHHENAYATTSIEDGIMTAFGSDEREILDQIDVGGISALDFARNLKQGYHDHAYFIARGPELQAQSARLIEEVKLHGTSQVLEEKLAI